MKQAILEVDLTNFNGKDKLEEMLEDYWYITHVTPILNCTEQGGTYTKSLVYVLEK